jgi:predicted TIM-barrel fold metal-dependent hydrolase
MSIVDAHMHFFNVAAVGKPKNEIFDTKTIITTMIHHGVDKAVLMQNPVIGIRNDEALDMMKQYPGIFKGSIQVDPVDPAASKTIAKYAACKDMCMVKFEMSREWGWTGKYSNLKLDGNEMMRIWGTCVRLDLAVIIDAGHPFNNGYQVEAIDRITSEYPEMIFLIEHLGGLSKEDLHKKESLIAWEQLCRQAQKSNVYLGLSSVSMFLQDAYPCRQSLEILKRVWQIVGSNKIVWGSDAPSTLQFYTYQQLLDIVLIHADFLNDADKRLIMGENALRLFWNGNGTTS